jgi:DnaJ-class molecular chaperone
MGLVAFSIELESTCGRCGGRGRLPKMVQGIPVANQTVQCASCKGKGTLENEWNRLLLPELMETRP